MKGRNKTPGTINPFTINNASFVTFNAKISGFYKCMSLNMSIVRRICENLNVFFL